MLRSSRGRVMGCACCGYLIRRSHYIRHQELWEWFDPDTWQGPDINWPVFIVGLGDVGYIARCVECGGYCDRKRDSGRNADGTRREHRRGRV